MGSRVKLISWDVALVIGVVLVFIFQNSDHLDIIVGFTTALVLTNCVTNHIAAYKLNGKIY